MDRYHQRLFRFLMNVKICSKQLAEETLDEICDDDNQQALDQCILHINQIIKKYDLEIALGRSELNGHESIALIQLWETNSNGPNKSVAVKKSSDLFSKLLSIIANSQESKITETDAVNTGSCVGLNKAATQVAIDDLESNKWLECHNGFVYLGVRTILELGQLIASNYPNSGKSCPLCRKLVFHGEICRGCKNKIHITCMSKYLEQNKKRHHCPSCKRSLEDQHSEEEDSFSDEQSTSHNLPGPSKRPKLK